MAECRARCGTDAVADSKDDVEVVVVWIAGDLPGVFWANYSEFPNGSFRLKLDLEPGA